jgi:hypothetical protein
MDEDKILNHSKSIIAIDKVLTLTFQDLLSKHIPPGEVFQRVTNGTKTEGDCSKADEYDRRCSQIIELWCTRHIAFVLPFEEFYRHLGAHRYM